MERLLRRLSTARLRLVVLIDEFDYLVDRCVARHSEFFASLRALAIGDHRALAVIAATRRSTAQLNELAREHGYNGSPYFNTFAEVLLGPLSEAEIDEILLPAQNRFSPDERRLIHDLSGGYPYLVQAAADILWRAHDSVPDPAARRRVAGADLLRVASQMLNDIWIHWPPRMRYLFASVALEHLSVLSRRVGSVVDTASFPEELHALERHGMIARDERAPAGFVVRPIIFLAWCAVLLRNNSQSTAQWRSWIHAEGWDTLLSPRRKEFWEGPLRERAGGAQTDVEVLLNATAALLSGALGI